MDAIDVDAARLAWEHASEELGIDVVTQGAALDANGERFEVVAVIPSFGGRNGAVVLGDQHRASFDVAKTQGFFPSIVSAAYEHFDRELFVETLNDWGWHGVGDPPAWYTGAASS